MFTTIFRRRISLLSFYLGASLALTSVLTSCVSWIQPGNAPTASATAEVTITVNTTQPLRKSAFSSGMTNSDTGLFDPWRGNDHQAVQQAKTLLKEGMSFLNTQIMGWGADDPWPDPARAEPDNWETLDKKLQVALQTQTTPVLTLCEAPWWMKGQLQAGGKTRLLTRTEDFSDIAYQSRVLDSKMEAWLHLVKRVAERYMAPPYNVRYFQVWNELKGYYNPDTNNWDVSVSPGKPTGVHAQHGYTYMYNRVYETLRQVARERGLRPEQISIGGPYVPMNTWSSVRQSHPSKLVKPYGIYDQRSLDAVSYWLEHKAGAEFITVDGSNQNEDNVALTDPFTSSEKLADVVTWIRSLDTRRYPGASTLPIWWAEWYAMPTTKASHEYDNALKTYALSKAIKAGSALTLSWGSETLWSATSAGGGKPLPWYSSYKALKESFGAGTQLYAAVSSSPRIEVLASAKMTVMVNKTARSLSVAVNEKVIALRPYQVLFFASN